jgi:hypothetical protein
MVCSTENIITGTSFRCALLAGVALALRIMAGCGYVDLAAARVDAWEHALVMRFTETRGLVGWRQHEAQWQVPALARRPPTADELCGWRGVFADDDFDDVAPQAGPKRTAAGIDVSGTRFFDWDYAPPRIAKYYRTEAPAVPSTDDRASGPERPQRIASTTACWFDSLVPTPEAPPLTASQQLAAIEARRRRGRPVSVRSGDDYDSQGRGSIELAPPACQCALREQCHRRFERYRSPPCATFRAAAEATSSAKRHRRRGVRICLQLLRDAGWCGERSAATQGSRVVCACPAHLRPHGAQDVGHDGRDYERRHAASLRRGRRAGDPRGMRVCAGRAHYRADTRLRRVAGRCGRHRETMGPRHRGARSYEARSEFAGGPRQTRLIGRSFCLAECVDTSLPRRFNCHRS